MAHIGRSRGLVSSALLAVVIAPMVQGGGHDAGTHRRPGKPGSTLDVLGGYSSNHIVVKFTPGRVKPGFAPIDAPTATWAGARSAAGARFESLTSTPPGRAGPVLLLSPALRTMWERWGVARMRRLCQHRFGNPKAAARYGLDRTFILEVPAGTDTPAMAAAFASFRDEIEVAEPGAIGGVADGAIPGAEFWRQWGMHNTGQTGGVVDADIDAPEAWKLHTGDHGTVTVAIIDSGVDPHVEFEGRMVPGINTAGLDPNDTSDGCPHGTHVAGIVAAAGDNGIGVAGVTWGANIMPVRVLLDPPDGCGGYHTDVADGMIWAVDHDADILNISLQFCNGRQALEDAVNYAHDHGVLVVSAAGNTDFWEYYCHTPIAIAFPARYANSMAVSATNRYDVLADVSNWGHELDVCAPGESIYSTWVGPPYPWYTSRSGTSMATPHVSGLAALIKSYIPALTPDEIRTVLTVTADDLGPDGWDILYGYGRINAHQALLTFEGWPRIAESSPPYGSIDAGQPSEPDGSNEAGWWWVDVTMTGDTSDLTDTSFTVSQAGGVTDPPLVEDLLELGDNVFRVILGGRISVGAWTTITHVESGTSARLGFLPGDSDGDGISSGADIVTLMDALDGVTDPPIWSVDIDRSGALTPADLLREIDLLTGAEEYEPFLGATLP